MVLHHCEKTDRINLDDNCVKILTIMTLYKPRTHFNELFRELKKRNMEISKPTLIAHLNHLIMSGFVSKKSEQNTQLVTYYLDVEKTNQLKKVAERTKRITKALKENEKEFYSLPEEEQVATVVLIEISRKIDEIRALIDYKLNPNDLGKIVYANFLQSPILHFGEKWIIKKSLEDEQYRKKVFKLLNEWQERFK